MNKDFGAFELHEKIGSGGMASVYRGIQKSLGRPVVLKILYPHLAEDEKLVARFEREARAAALMRHENIVQIIDWGRHEDVAYIAMEYVEGMDLKKWLEAHPPPLEMGLLILRDVCRGLEHAHTHGIVHRDIKPANIMFTPDGAIKLMDFGLARRGEESTNMTVAGTVLGTAAYMSPEQATGESVDERSDVFSAGIVAYELLGGRRPFEGDSYSAVLRSIITVEAPPLEWLNPLVPVEVVQVVHKMLQKDITKRAQNIETVRGDLETVIETMGLHRSKDLLREYARDPERVTQVLGKKALTSHMEQGLRLETMGPDKIDDAALEFRRVLHLEPSHRAAKDHLKKIEEEQARMEAERAEPPDDGTLVLEPEEVEKMRGAPPPRRDAPPPVPRPGPKPIPAVKPPGREPTTSSSARRAAAAAQAARAKRAARPVDRTRTILMIAAGVLSVAIVVALFAVLGGRKPEKITPTETNGGTSTVPSPPLETRAQTPTPTQVQAPATTPTESAPLATTAALRVTTKPSGASIRIDGQMKTDRSNTVIGDLEPGKHQVEVEKEGFVTMRRDVRLAAGQQGEVFITLPQVGAEPVTPRGEGKLLVRVDPFADIYVDDVLKSTGRVSSELTLESGKHRIKAVHPSFDAKTWSGVLIEPGKTTTLAWNFETSSVGSVRIVLSGGGWADVWVDGRKYDHTAPCVVERLKAGKHTIELRRDGFQIEGTPQDVVVTAGATTEARFRLKEKP